MIVTSQLNVMGTYDSMMSYDRIETVVLSYSPYCLTESTFFPRF